MRKRPAQTISERELVFALGKTGRQAGLSDLGAWRRAGLLPPFASCGTGAGRSYYWSQPDIVVRALAVHDALALGGRIDAALISIWLMGFDAPLPRLRRALLHRMRILATVSEAPAVPDSRRPSPQAFALMELVHPGAASVGSGWQTIRSRSELRHHLNRLSQLYRPLVQNADLIRRSTDADLLKARHYLLGLLTDQERAVRAIAAAETLFLFLLALVRSGQTEILKAVDGFSEAAGPMPEVRAAS